LNSADCLFPDRLPKPDAELLDHQSPPAGGEEMPDLVDNDQEVKKNNNLKENEKDAKEMKQHFRQVVGNK
jgi:hypothetical protein